MPSSTTWGGVRWVRNRTNYNGSWYIGYTALDATDDIVFGCQNSGTQIDNIMRLYNSALGSATQGVRVSRDLYVSGNTSGNYGNRLVVGNTDTSYTLQDGSFRPTIQAHGAYPVVSLNHTVTSNASHGPTLQFTCNGTGNQFVIGTNGTGTRLDIGTSSNGSWNPHNGIDNYLGTTGFRMDTSGNVYNFVATYSPIFRDNNDPTNYYVDPNGTSSLSNLTVNGTLNAYSNPIVVNRINFRTTSGGTSSDPYCLRFVENSSNDCWLEFQLNDDNNEELRIYGNSCSGYGCGEISGNLYHRFRADGWAWHADYVEGGNSVRGPIFRDSNDPTNYFVDPTGTSALNTISLAGALVNTNAGIRVTNPGGASYATTNNIVTGAIKIRLPAAALGSNTMMSFRVSVYDYSTGNSQQFIISGYNYSDASYTWYNVSAISLSDTGPSYTVRFGKDGTSQCVYIGELNTSWNYPQVFVTDFCGGYAGATSAIWASGWDISFESSAFAGVTVSRTAGSTGGATLTNDTSTNATWYPTLSSATSGTYTTAYVSNTKLTFNPSTGTLSATIFTSLSDETQKTNIEKITSAVDLTRQINGVKFEWKENGGKSAGVIAQEVEKIMPEIVHENDDGIKTVNYNGIIALLVEALKEQQEQIDELKKAIKTHK